LFPIVALQNDSHNISDCMARISPDLLPDIFALIKVIERGTLTAAAGELGITPSGVSKQLARLERRLDTRLIARTTRRLKPTEAGMTLYHRCRDLFEAFGEAEQAVREISETLSGKIRVTATPAFGRAYLVPALAAFACLHPDLRFDVALTAGHLDLVEDGLDLAIREGTLADSSLIATKLGEASIALYAAPEYLKTRSAPQRLEDLTEHDVVTVLPGHLGDGEVRWPLPAGGRITLLPRFQVNDLYCVRQLAADGCGIAALPSYMVGVDVGAGSLERVLPDVTLPGIRITALTPERRFQSAKVRTLLDFLVERFRGAMGSLN